MLIELVNIVKFLLEIFKGNIPMTQLYVITGILNILVNSGLTFFLIKYGYNHEERQNNTRKLYKATSSS